MMSKIQYRFIVPVALCVSISMLAGLFYINHVLNANNDKTINNTAKHIQNTMTSAQAQIENYCLSHAALFSQYPTVIQAYNLAHQGNMKDENSPQAQQARELLAKNFNPINKAYTSITQQSRYALHFHLPTGRSLLRVWKSGKQTTSDDISTFRQTVLDISKNHNPIKGIEIGRGGFAIRGIAPVIENNNYLGSVEMLSSYNPLVLNTEKEAKDTLSVFMNAEYLSIATSLTDEAKYPRLDNAYVLVASSNPDRAMLRLKKSMLDEAKLTAHSTQLKKNHITVSPINDYNGKQIGLIVFDQDIEEQLAALSGQRTLLISGAAITLAIIIAIILFITLTITKPLNNIIHTLADNSQQVAVAAEDIAESSSAQADFSSEQAANLEETSSSLEEISSMTKQNADNANTANTISNQAKQFAQKGCQTMQLMVETINKIQSSADETAKIVKIIDEIAFQTNLLALNAAVEAARAGEAGKGFAVVAEEVRNLALRSAEAAKNTTQLIEESVNNTKEGVTATGQINELLEEIAKTISQTADLIDGISSATNEQSQGIEQINLAMSNMDKLTQSNVSNTENSASASDQLTHLAGNMDTVVKDLAKLTGNV